MSLITDIQKNLNTLQEQFRVAAEQALTSGFAAFFEKYPQVKTICWNQYIPSFNDGEPCEFSIGEIYFTPTLLEDLPEEWDYEFFEDYEEEVSEGAPFSTGDKYERDENGRYISTETFRDPRMTEEMAKDMASMAAIIQQNDGLIESAYGSNAFVYISKDKVVTGDWDCGF